MKAKVDKKHWTRASLMVAMLLTMILVATGAVHAQSPVTNTADVTADQNDTSVANNSAAACTPLDGVGTVALGQASVTADESDTALANSSSFNCLLVVAANTAPTITTGTSVNAQENQTTAVDVDAADDNDSEGSGLTYSISGGADQGLFSIDSSTGVVSFDSAPDYENPNDANTDGVYEVEVTVTDSGSLTAVQTFNITLIDDVADNDTTPPTPSVTTPATHDGSTAFDITVDFGEDVTGFAAGDVSVSNATVGSVSGGPQSYTVQITPDGSNSDIAIDIAAAAVQDGAGNDSTAATQQTVIYQAVDTTAPTPSITVPATHDGSTAFDITVDFGEDVTGFAAGDVSVSNATVGSVSGGPQSYTVQVTPDGSNSDITIDIAAAAVQDGAGNDSTAATQQTVIYSAPGGTGDPITVPAAVTGTEDISIPLGITADPVLFQGGAQYDLIGTEAGFRDASAGTTPTNFTIPADTAAIRITAYGGHDNGGGGGGAGDQEDYQTITMLVDLDAGSYSGHIVHVRGQTDTNNDNYTFDSVALGSASDSGSTIGDSNNNWNSVTVDVSGNTLSIVESQSLTDQAYLVEYLGAATSSANFVESLGDVMDVSDTSTTLSLSASVDFVIVSILEGRGGAGNTHEDKGLSRIIVDLEDDTASGTLFNQKGRGGGNTAAYAFAEYDITAGTAILSSGATVVGDTSAAANVLPDLTITRSGNDLTISRTADTATLFTALVSAQGYERVALGSAASAVGAAADSANYVDNVSVVNRWELDVPGSADTGFLSLAMYNYQGSDGDNENTGTAQIFVDLRNNTTSGAFLAMRNVNPDLVSWEGVPFGTRIFEGTNTVTNHAALADFGDEFPGVLTFNLVTQPDGSRILEATAQAVAGGGGVVHLNYKVVMQVQWSGRLPLAVSNVPAGASLSAGSYDADSDRWLVPVEDASTLALTPPLHYSGVGTQMALDVDYDGEVDIINVAVTRVADAPTLVTTDQSGDEDAVIDISGAITATLVDTDTSESLTLIELSGIPDGHTVADGSNSFTASAISDTVDVGGWTLGSLTYQGAQDTNGTFPIGVRAQSTDNDGFSPTPDTAESTDSFTMTLNAVNDAPIIDQPATDTAAITIAENTTVITDVNASDVEDGAETSLTYGLSGADALSMTVDANGNLSFLTAPDYETPSSAAGTNVYSVTVTVADSSGLTDTVGMEIVVTNEIEALSVDPVNSGETVSGASAGSLSITGSTEPGITVTVTITDDQGTVISQTVVADGAGIYSATFDASGLDDGTLQVAALAEDASGTTFGPELTTVALDATPPAAPAMTEPAASALITDTTPLIRGSGEPGAEIAVEIGGQTLTTTVDVSGTWRVTPAALVDGVYTPTFTIADPAGNVTGPTAGNSFEIDSGVTAPSMTTPTDGAVTNDTTPLISGSAEPGAEVTVEVDGQTLTTTVATDGTWGVTPGVLSDDVYTPTLRIVDEAGNSAGPVDGNSFEIDGTGPTTPVMVSPAHGVSISDSTPLITGTAEAGATVTITVNNEVLTTTVDGSGTWSMTPTALADGTYTPTLRIEDPAGNVAGPADGNVFTVDATVPGVTIDTPVDTDGTVSGASAGSLAITGDTEPGAEVTVTITDTSGNVVTATATADAGGLYTATLDVSGLDDGDLTVESVAVDAAGNTSAPSTTTVTLDATAPTAPIMEEPVASALITDTTPVISGSGEPGAEITVDVGGQTLTTTVDVSGTWSVTPSVLVDDVYTPTLTVTDAAGNVTGPGAGNSFEIDTTAPNAPVMTAPAPGAIITNTAPLISGSGEPGADLTVEVGGQTLNTTVVANGTWSVTPAPLADGVYTPVLTTTDAAGNSTGPVNGNSFEIDTTGPTAPTMSEPAPEEVISDPTPTIGGTAEPGTLITVEVGAQTLTTTVDVSGTWSVTPGVLIGGVYTPTITVTDPAGNSTGPVDGNAFTVDTTAPVTTIDTPVDDDDIVGSASASSLEITGSSEPGAQVTVAITDTSGATVTAMVTAGASGAYTATLDVSGLDEGTLTVLAVGEDAAGNVGAVATTTVTLDTIAPVAPTMSGPEAGAALTDTTPLITGTGEPGAEVAVEVGGQTLTATVDVSGTWSVTPGVLPEDVYTPTVTITDPAGNSMGPIEGTSFEIDTTAPLDPTMSEPGAGTVITDTTPLISGTGEPGVEVTVAVGGQMLTATVDMSGIWRVTPGALADSVYTPTITVTDPAGNVAGPVEGNRFQVDTTPPAAPGVSEPISGTVVITNTPVISGTTEPSATVEVLDETGSVLCTTTADADGNYVCTVTEPQPEGELTLAVQATDPAGYTGDPTPVTVVIDTDDDIDGDGVSNGDEATLGTDPADPDSDSSLTATVDENDNGTSDADEDLDGDGATNAEELAAGSDPLDDSNTPDDPDGDGLTNEQETLLGTDPTDPDSDSSLTIDVDESDNGTSDADEDVDGDGAGNLEELEAGSDPLDAASTPDDRDGDGVSNEDEATLGTDPDDADSDSSNTVDVDENDNGTSDAEEDFDGDGVSNLEELNQGSDPLDESSTPDDRDGDGVSNEDEATLGTDPDDADSDSSLTGDADENDNGTSDADEDLDGDGVSNIDELEAGSDPLDAASTPDDRDGDGLTNEDESTLGTDPDDADSDSSLTPDADENDNGTSDADEDLDGDGVSNIDELDAGSDPLDETSTPSDADGDGLSDAIEATLGTDPDDADSDSSLTPDADENDNGTSDADEDLDGDGVSNIDELDAGSDPLDETSTPSDADGDGLSDAIEATLGTDPDDADSDSSLTPDADENDNGTSDADEDLDGDGVSNIDELDAGSDPLDGMSTPDDPDGDGLSNEQEALLGTDPDDADSNSVKTPEFEGGNGTSDAEEDFDGDGVSNIDELEAGSDPTDPTSKPSDRDGDGLTNAQEALLGTDPDDADSDSSLTEDADEGDNGTSDADEDLDGDGVSNLEELNAGSDPLDETSTPDYTDSDGDGIVDAKEDLDGDGDPSNDDTDGDGTPDYLDTDDDGDGTPTLDEDRDGDGNPLNDDRDGDGIPGFLDENDDEAGAGDSDGDGTTDDLECPNGSPCVDSDDDGTPDYMDADDDGDGVPTASEDINGDGDPSNDDTDGDGTPDYLDTDDDNDGELTTDEDVDGDGDASNDDQDGDKIPDYLDAMDDGPDAGDSDGDGVPDDVECPDGIPCVNTDGDLIQDPIPDYLDSDDDGDGIITLNEDTDGDRDPTNDDTDGDGIPNYVDFDDDGPGPGDSDGDLVPDDMECPDGVPCPDTDGDTHPDYTDVDDDGDGTDTAEEDGNDNGDLTDDDSDRDGVPDYLDSVADRPGDGDNDGDGLLDSEECALGTLCRDTDGDGIVDYLDADDDGDGEPTIDEIGFRGEDIDADDDGDGIPNYLDSGVSTDGSNDSDGDGVSDDVECPNGVPCPDPDGDGIPAYMDDSEIYANAQRGIYLPLIRE